MKEPNCGAATGTLQLDSATGGTPPYTVHWSTGGTTVSINDIAAGTYYLTITDNNGCVYTFSDSVPCITGIDNITAAYRLSVYPNPAGDYAVVDYSFITVANTPLEIEVCNALGQTVYRRSTDAYAGLQKIDLQTFAAGVYTVLMKCNKQIIAASRLVKQ